MRDTVAVAEDVRVTQEVLEAGPQAPRRGIPAAAVWALGIGALVILTVANVLAITDFAARTIEADALITAVERSEASMMATQEEFATVMATVDRESLTDQEREALRTELTELAQESQESIGLAGIGVADVSVLPWHTSITNARDVYLEHNSAWVDYMAAAAADPAEWFRPQAAVNDTFADARVPLIEAVPLVDVLQTLARIEFIYVSGSGDSGSEQAA